MDLDWDQVGEAVVFIAAAVAAVAGLVSAYFGYLSIIQARDYREDARLEQIGFRLVALAEPEEGTTAIKAPGWAHRGAMLHVLTVGDPRLPKCRAVAEKAANDGKQPDGKMLDEAWDEFQTVFIARFPDRAPQARPIWVPIDYT